MAAAPEPSRRAFLFGRRPVVAALRPPWALDEADFLDTCTGCQACIAQCPEQVLRRGDGGYPVFDPGRGECTFCEACTRACEPRALDRQRAVPWSQSAVMTDRCLPRHGVVCTSCRDACAESAIRFPLTAAVPVPSVDAQRCTGCGACVSPCPVDAIEIRLRNPEVA